MMERDPITGPISRDELKALSAAPFGDAAKAIRKHDPLWGLEDGSEIKWKIEFRREQTGYAIVRAATEKGAGLLADKIPADAIEWEDDDISIETIDPAKPGDV